MKAGACYLVRGTTRLIKVEVHVDTRVDALEERGYELWYQVPTLTDTLN